MSIDQLAHTDSLEMLAMFEAAFELEETLSPEEFDQMERETFCYQDGPRAYAH